MKDLVSREMAWGLPLLEFENNHLCGKCECRKQAKKGHPVLLENSICKPLELLHIDLYGPSTVEILHPKKYIFVIVDDYIGFYWVFFLRLKLETTFELIKFSKGIKVLTKLHVRRVRGGNETEFKNPTHEVFMVDKGVEHNFSTPYITQQKCVLERRNRTLVEVAGSMLNF